MASELGLKVEINWLNKNLIPQRITLDTPCSNVLEIKRTLTDFINSLNKLTKEESYWNENNTD